MDTLIRSSALFIFLLLIFRLSGKRTLQQVTIFDFVMLLIISETTQQALLDSDPSFTNSVLVITLFLCINIGLSIVKHRSPKVEKLLDGCPVIIVEHGTELKDRMDKARVDKDDVLEAARELHGLERLDQIKYAVLEKNGKISIIPAEGAK